MKVFIVHFGAYSDRYTAGVFSTQELAQQYIAKHGDQGDGDIDEFEIDEYATHVRGTCYMALIDLEGGNILEQKSWPYIHDPHVRSAPPEINDFRSQQKSLGAFSVPSFGYLSAEVNSYVSADHALKLAAECRQSYLRQKAAGEKINA